MLLSKITLYELKSIIREPLLGHCSLMYIYNCVEYFQIFSVANEPTKRGRVRAGTMASHAERSRDA